MSASGLISSAMAGGVSGYTAGRGKAVSYAIEQEAEEAKRLRAENIARIKGASDVEKEKLKIKADKDKATAAYTRSESLERLKSDLRKEEKKLKAAKQPEKLSASDLKSSIEITESLKSQLELGGPDAIQEGLFRLNSFYRDRNMPEVEIYTVKEGKEAEHGWLGDEEVLPEYGLRVKSRVSVEDFAEKYSLSSSQGAGTTQNTTEQAEIPPAVGVAKEAPSFVKTQAAEPQGIEPQLGDVDMTPSMEELMSQPPSENAIRKVRSAMGLEDAQLDEPTKSRLAELAETEVTLGDIIGYPIKALTPKIATAVRGLSDEIKSQLTSESITNAAADEAPSFVKTQAAEPQGIEPQLGDVDMTPSMEELMSQPPSENAIRKVRSAMGLEDAQLDEPTKSRLAELAETEVTLGDIIGYPIKALTPKIATAVRGLSDEIKSQLTSESITNAAADEAPSFVKTQAAEPQGIEPQLGDVDMTPSMEELMSQPPSENAIRKVRSAMGLEDAQLDEPTKSRLAELAETEVTLGDIIGYPIKALTPKIATAVRGLSDEIKSQLTSESITNAAADFSTTPSKILEYALRSDVLKIAEKLSISPFDALKAYLKFGKKSTDEGLEELRRRQENI